MARPAMRRRSRRRRGFCGEPRRSPAAAEAADMASPPATQRARPCDTLMSMSALSVRHSLKLLQRPEPWLSLAQFALLRMRLSAGLSVRAGDASAGRSAGP